MNHETDIDRSYLYSKDPYEAKHELLIDNTRSAGLKYLNDLKGFIEYSNDVGDI